MNTAVLARKIFLLALAVLSAALLRQWEWHEAPAVFWEPVSFFRAFTAPPFGRLSLIALSLTFPAAAFLSAFRPGVLFSAVTFISGWLLLGYGMNFGKVDHYFHLVAVALFADFLFQVHSRLRPQNPSSAALNLSRFVQIALVLLYVSSGLRKLVASGPSWFTSNNMEIMLLDHGLSAGAWLTNASPLPNLLAFGSVVLEISSPLALFSPWLALLFVASWLLMHLSIYVFMGPNFLFHSLTFLFFLPLLAGTWKSRASFSRSRFFFACVSVYCLLSLHQVIFKLETWPLSSFPMYETDLSSTGIRRYELIDAAGAKIPLTSFPPFRPASLERSLRKSAEKGRKEILAEKMEYLSSRAGKGPLRLMVQEWREMQSFDPAKPENTSQAYP